MEELIKRIVEWSRGNPQGPLSIHLDPTNRCNLRCRFCWQRSHERFGWLDRKHELPEKKLLESKYLSSQGNILLFDTRNEFQIVTTHIVRPCFDGLSLKLYKPKLSFNFNGSKCKYSRLVLPYIFVRGCPNGCTFCTYGIIPFYEIKKPSAFSNFG